MLSGDANAPQAVHVLLLRGMAEPVLESLKFGYGRFVMDNTKRLLINIGGILAVSIIGAILMMGVDHGGTRWLKFVLYVALFATISSPAAFSSRYSCSGMLRRLHKRS
jgi:hypothetical protein